MSLLADGPGVRQRAEEAIETRSSALNLLVAERAARQQEHDAAVAEMSKLVADHQAKMATIADGRKSLAGTAGAADGGDLMDGLAESFDRAERDETEEFTHQQAARGDVNLLDLAAGVFPERYEEAVQK